MARIEIAGLVKRYGADRAVDGVDLTIEDGQFVVLLGPSGCGKTTILRMVAGLEQISEGELRFDGRLMNDEPPERRGVGMVFQNYALYPHMTVAANLSFGLESRRARGSRRTARAAERERVLEVARMLEIDHVLGHRPKELSGGQRQRVALGRALIRKPDVFLLDEPLSNLDANLRDKMRMELARLHALVPVSTVYVTHDQGEALTLADLLVVMREGRICQAGTPGEVYAQPADTFVAGFLGSPGMNLWSLPEDPARANGTSSASALRLPRSIAEDLRAQPRRIVVGIRPEHLALAGTDHASLARIECEVDLVENLGSHLLVHAHLASDPGATLIAKLEPQASVHRSERVLLAASEEHLHCFDAATGVRVAPHELRSRRPVAVRA